MKRFLTLLLLFTYSNVQVINSQTQELLFEDRFYGQKLDTTRWKYELGHRAFVNSKVMCYKSENVVINNGLRITAKPETVQCDDGITHFTSGRIKTKHMFNFTYIEAKARLSKGKNLQPAVWTKYSGEDIYEEIDLVELKGIESDKLVTSVHWGNMRPRNLNKSNIRKTTVDLSKDYHVYAVDRTQSDLIFYLDNVEYYRVNRLVGGAEIISKPAYFLLNISVGGDWFKDNVTTEEAQLWPDPSMDVEYIRIYGYK